MYIRYVHPIGVHIAAVNGTMLTIKPEWDKEQTEHPREGGIP